MRWIGANDLALGVFIAIIVTAVALALLERWGVKNKWLRWPAAGYAAA